MTKPCPCGRADARGRLLTLSQCCGRWLDEPSPPLHGGPPDAESLMRSRYTAFVLERADYLLATWAATHRPPQLVFQPGVRWLGLEVRGHKQDDEAHAQVEFVARHRDHAGRAVRLHERSRFVREGGRWYYLDGDIQ